MEQYLKKLAKVIVHYSVGVKKGDLLKLKGEPVAIPLLKEFYREALAVGAYPYLDIDVVEIHEIFFKHASEDQLKHFPVVRDFEVDKMDSFIAVWGAENTRTLSGVDSRKQQLWSQTTRPITEKMFARMGDRSLRWCGTQFPTRANAQDAGMSLDEYAEFVFRAGHLHEDDPVAYWKKVRSEQDRLVNILNDVERIHVRADGTDLKLNVAGRKWINCCGTENFPDGEIFTCPIEDSAEGTVRFTYPAYYHGREVEGVVFSFKNGVAEKAEASRNHKFLTDILDMDEGGRRIGEFAIGTNYEIKQFTRNTLFDEKIGGTFHMAMGASLPEAGGKNKSGFHWDMVCDMHEGEITADGKIIYRNGKFEI